MKAYIPQNLPLDLFPDKHKDKYFYFIHKIYEEKLFNKGKEFNSYVNLNAKFMQNIIGRYLFEPVRRELIENGIIESDKRYIVGKKSIGYCLTNQYADIKHKVVLLQDNKLINKIQEFKIKANNNIPDGIEYKKLSDCLDKITIDHKSAIDFIDSKYSLNTKKWNCSTMAVNKINDKDFRKTVDSTSGRFHTNITSLSRDLRQFLRINDKKLINIDCSNSQPFLFNILINKYLNNNNSYDIINNKSLHTNNTYILPYDRYYDRHSASDVELYLNLTSKGLFYEFLMEKLNYTGDRHDFKKDFFGKVFYSENNPKYVFKERIKFKELFPTVSGIIDYYKKEDHRNLPIALQKAEREIIINKIVKRIVTESPDLPINTIHDSILTTVGNENYVKDIMKQEFYKQYKLIPTIK